MSWTRGRNTVRDPCFQPQTLKGSTCRETISYQPSLQPAPDQEKNRFPWACTPFFGITVVCVSDLLSGTATGLPQSISLVAAGRGTSCSLRDGLIHMELRRAIFIHLLMFRISKNMGTTMLCWAGICNDDLNSRKRCA